MIFLFLILNSSVSGMNWQGHPPILPVPQVSFQHQHLNNHLTYRQSDLQIQQLPLESLFHHVPATIPIQQEQYLAAINQANFAPMNAEQQIGSQELQDHLTTAQVEDKEFLTFLKEMFSEEL